MDSDTKIRNKTYEQYREEIKPDIYAEIGEVITCQNGDYMGVFACTTYVDDDLSSLDIDITGTKVVHVGGHPDRCSVCGGLSVNLVSKGGLKYSSQVRFWMDNHWRVRKYP